MGGKPIGVERAEFGEGLDGGLQDLAIEPLCRRNDN
jgi:hypothetical protein